MSIGHKDDEISDEWSPKRDENEDDAEEADLWNSIGEIMEPVAKVENYDITVGTEAEADDLRWPKLSDLLLAWSAQSCQNEEVPLYINGVLSSELCQAAEELGTDEDHVIQAGSNQVSYDPFRRMHFSDLDNNLGWEQVKRTLFKNHMHRKIT